MALHKHVSDPKWTTRERIEVLEAFMEHANQSLQGKLFEDIGLSAPYGSASSFKIRFDLKTGAMTFSESILRLSMDECDTYIQRLRPFILSSEDIFLPKITRQIVCLLKNEHKEKGEELVSWVEQFVSFEKEFKPHCYQSLYNHPDGSSFSTSNADLALDYIYGRAVKVDLEKRRNLKQIEKFDNADTEIAKALTIYLEELMRLVLRIKNRITQWHANNSFINEMQAIKIGQ